MTITKYVHSCLLVETSERAVLFDPGGMSQEALTVESLSRLDDLVVTHIHGDHLCLPLLRKLMAKFPDVRLTTTAEIVNKLETEEGLAASITPPDGLVLFWSAHEPVEPLFVTPQQIGVHYLDVLTNPGDSHGFRETKQILALPVQAPWGSTVAAVKLSLKLKPGYILPIHDWHWSDAARQAMYATLDQAYTKAGIKFIKLQTGVPVTLEL